MYLWPFSFPSSSSSIQLNGSIKIEWLNWMNEWKTKQKPVKNFFVLPDNYSILIIIIIIGRLLFSFFYTSIILVAVLLFKKKASRKINNNKIRLFHRCLFVFDSISTRIVFTLLFVTFISFSFPLTQFDIKSNQIK